MLAFLRHANGNRRGLQRDRLPVRLSHFQLSWQHLGLWRGCSAVVRAAVGDSAIFAREDNAAFDMTVHSAHRWNTVGPLPLRCCHRDGCLAIIG